MLSVSLNVNVFDVSGFQELNQDDQIKLIKQGSFEVVLARYTPLFQQDGMFIPTMEAKVPRYVHYTSIPNLGSEYPNKESISHDVMNSVASY